MFGFFIVKNSQINQKVITHISVSVANFDPKFIYKVSS